jgi:hypothetical protein
MTRVGKARKYSVRGLDPYLLGELINVGVLWAEESCLMLVVQTWGFGVSDVHIRLAPVRSCNVVNLFSLAALQL